MEVVSPSELFSGRKLHRVLSVSGYRMVEHQGKAATAELVDTLDEQLVLERLLDDSKPPYRPHTEALHYLLRTPFRYPPLTHGSRFGTRVMASFFYASEDPKSCLAEVAYYRFIFLSDMETQFPTPIRSRHEMFTVRFRTHHAVDLTRLSNVKPQLTDPSDYTFTQQLGSWLMEQGTDLIRYWSARHPDGVNLAAQPSALWSKTPGQRQMWFCHTTPDEVSFAKPDGTPPASFPLAGFLVAGTLPRPA
ncbi:MAG: RES family NAD+ phosphorylase [Acidobacteria bacterium]|nr:RES family NAD+ phosphorylase [Acidobacteriota bacterium]